MACYGGAVENDIGIHVVFFLITRRKNSIKERSASIWKRRTFVHFRMDEILMDEVHRAWRVFKRHWLTAG